MKEFNAVVLHTHLKWLIAFHYLLPKIILRDIISTLTKPDSGFAMFMIYFLNNWWTIFVICYFSVFLSQIWWFMFRITWIYE